MPSHRPSAQGLRTLISTPSSSCQAASAPSTSTTPDQLAKVDELIAYFGSDAYRVLKEVKGKAFTYAPAPHDEEDGETWKLREDEKIFLSREGITRFLVATKWDLPAAKARLDKCVAWRRAFGVYDLERVADEVAPESPSGKEFVLGYTTKSQPILHFRPNRSTTETSDRQLKHVVYMLERTADLFPPGVGNLCLLIDFAGKRQAPTSPGMAKNFITILQDFYPERLGMALLSSIPWIVRKFLDFAFTFVDPITKQKVQWNVDVVQKGIAPSETALREYGGEIEFEYVHEEYWPTLLQVCLERREQHRQRWRELGGTVGLSEWDFKQEQAAATLVEEPAEIQPSAAAYDHDVSPKTDAKPALPHTSTTVGPNVQTTSTGSLFAVDEDDKIASSLPSDLANMLTFQEARTIDSDIYSPSTTTTLTNNSRSKSISSTRSDATMHENHGLSEEEVKGVVDAGQAKLVLAAQPPQLAKVVEV